MEERFDHLDAPVMRVTYPDTHPPFSHVLEAANLPNADKIADALRSSKHQPRLPENIRSAPCSSVVCTGT